MATQTITITSDFRNGNNCKVGSEAFSHAEGFETSAIGDYSHSEGVSTKASAEGAHASGIKAVASHKYSTVWNGDSTKTVESSSEGTYVMNPVGGASGLFIGSKSFQSYIDEAASSGSEDISALKSAVQTISGEIDGAVSSTNKAQGKNYIDTEVAKKQDKLATQSAISNSLVKITTNTLGQVTGSVAVAKSDITALGIPSQDTKATVTVTGTGNAITGISAVDGAITATKGSTFLTSVPSNYVKNTDALSTINSNEIAGYLKKSDSLSSVNNNEISNYVKVSVTTGNQTADNPLVDKSFVNSSIQTNTASFRGAWATFSDVPTASGDYPSDVYGNKYPTVNDYLVVLADENHDDQTWRYKYTTSWETSGKSGWEAEYKVNDTAFTSEQNAAINSGITSDKVNSMTSHVSNSDVHVTTAQKTSWSAKQNALATQTAISNKFVKVTTNTLGQVTGSSAVAKSDITALGIPSQDTVTKVTTTGSGNVVASISDDGSGQITATKTTVVTSTADCVKTTGDQTIAGTKTFSSIPVVGTASVGTSSDAAASTDFAMTAAANAAKGKQDALSTQTAHSAGFYKIANNTLGQVTSATAVTKSDITNLGIPSSDTTYTFVGGVNKITVTPSVGTAKDCTITPFIANNITGSGTSGCLAKFDGASGITSGPAFGTDTDKYLNNKGEWETVSFSTCSNTATYAETANYSYTASSAWNASSASVAESASLANTAQTDSDGRWLNTLQSSSTAVKYGGKAAVGSATKPVYVDADGNATTCTYSVNKDVPSDAVFTDTVYTHPSATAYSSGLYKVTVSNLGHVTAATKATSADIAALGGIAVASTAVTHSASTAVGSATKPVYVASNGTATACTYSLNKDVPSDAKFTDTVYTHPSATAYESGLYKVTVSSLGHVTSASAVTSADINALGGIQDKATAVRHTANAAVGGTTTPVYVASDGTAKACSYSLNKTVPASAVFTDTLATVEINGSGNAVTAMSASNGKITATKGETFVPTSVTTGDQTANNPLVDKSFVNSSIQTNTASFRGSWATWSAVPTASGEYPADAYGTKAPTVNDYMVVLADENHSNQTWRYKYTSSWEVSGRNGWQSEYKVNDTAFTDAQNNAINSGISSTTVVKHTASTAIGSATKPVYVNASGNATACTYELNATVPSGAKFTDTVTTVTTNGDGNAITEITAANGAITATKGATFLNSSNGVMTTGDQTIAGTKTFSSVPVVGTASVGTSSDAAASTAFVHALIQEYLKKVLGSGVVNA